MKLLYMIPINKFSHKFNVEQNIRSTLSFPTPSLYLPEITKWLNYQMQRDL